MFSFHHIGYLAANLEKAKSHWIELYGCTPDGGDIHDVGQQARVCLLRQPGLAGWVELIAPDSESSHLQKALRSKVSLHHLAYAVDDFGQAIDRLRKAGCVPLCKPTIGMAFQREIIWFHDPERGLVELIAPGSGPYQLNS
ncbi:MAG: VOC family protein [Verrucomicrobiota bacterium]